MKIVVAGGTGLIGEPLVKRLVARGEDVVVLSRNPARVEVGRGVEWDARSQGAWSDEVASADVVINLAGENLGEGRWTGERKRRFVASRLNATNAIVEALKKDRARSRTLINASAIGYYGNRGDELLDESASRGTGFLAELVDQWESAARNAEPVARIVFLRFGLVLATDGGALKKMLLPFRLGGGGPIGSGEQWMSWVDRGDVVGMVEWVIDHPSARGIYNVTAPQPVRNRDFARTLGRVLHRPSFMPAPAFALRLVFGEMADEVLLAGQRVGSGRATAEGFVFTHTDLETTLRELLVT